MQTLNISITKEQYKLVDKLYKKRGFANRSEFFRAILRSLNNQEEKEFLPTLELLDDVKITAKLQKKLQDTKKMDYSNFVNI